MKIAILGMPSSGKRTMFTLLTGREITNRKENEIIEGRAELFDPRVEKISDMIKPKKTTYAFTDFVLCSDLETKSQKWPWAQEAALCDLLCIVVRDFESDQVYHPEGSVDATRDKENILMELIFLDLDLVEKRLTRLEKDKKGGKTVKIKEVEEQTLLKCREALSDNKKLDSVDFSEEELASINSLNFLTLKPLIWCLNVDEDRVTDTSKSESDTFIISALIEKEIMALTDKEEQKEYLSDLGLTLSGLDRLNQAAYDFLGLMSFYTMGKDEVRAWTIKKETVAKKAAGKIHSDIERGFIRVEIIKYDDLLEHLTEEAVKKAGKAQVKGKEYIIEDGDICHYLFNV